jgi:hypothetical protein
LLLDKQQLRRKDEQADLPCQLVVGSLDELRPHPSYVRNHLAVSASQLSALVELGDRAFLNPIVITRDRFVIEGFALLELARQQGRQTLQCIEYNMNETEGLQWLL